MNVLQNKSEENFQAIDILISSKLNAPVIHCAYYSCLQLIIHYTLEYSGLTEEQVQASTNGMGSHNFYLSTYTQEIKKLNPTNAMLFNQYFSKFKRKRTEADYHKIEILESDLLLARKNAIQIRKFLQLIDDEGKCENIHNI